jgi:secretion/DNA translocation related CpaE-like protein
VERPGCPDLPCTGVPPRPTVHRKPAGTFATLGAAGNLPGVDDVLLLTESAPLSEHVARLAAAVGVSVTVRVGPQDAGRRWLDAGLVLLGDDAAGIGVPLRRPGVVLLTADDTSGVVWRRAVESGVEAVVVLPRDEAWLIERLTEVADGGAPSAVVVGVLGGRGGAGASSLAVALATAAARRSLDVLVVDADPVGGGIDLLLGAEELPGLRWPDLVDVRGAVRAAVLREGLPEVGGVRLLAWHRGDPVDLPPAAMEAVLDAGRRGHELVLVDLPRRDDPGTLAALWRLDVLLLLVPAEVRAAASAGRLLDRVRPHVGDVRLVVRGPAPAGLKAEAVADAVGMPLWGRCDGEPALAAAADHGEPPGSRAGGPLARLCARLLDDLRMDELVGEAGRSRSAGPGRGAA